MARKPSLLYVTCSEIDRRTGAAVNEEESIRGLLACGSDFQIHAVVAYRDNSAVLPDLPDCTVTRVKGHGGRAWGVPFYWWRMLHAILDSVKRNDVDVIVYRISFAPLAELLIYLLTRKRFAVKTWRDPAEFFYSNFGRLGRIAAWFSRWLQGSVLRRAMVIDVQSKAWADWLCQVHRIERQRLLVIPNGASSERFVPPSEGDRSNNSARARFVFAGNFRSTYGLEALIKAVAMIPPDQRHFEVVLAGGGAEESQLRARIEQCGVAETFSFAGWVPYDELTKLFWSCDWGIDLSATQISRENPIQTTFSQKVSQYLFAGLPVIAWDIDGAEFLREEAVGLLASYSSIEDLARILCDASELAQSGQARTMGTRGAEYAAHERSQKAIAGRRCTVYRKALAAA